MEAVARENLAYSGQDDERLERIVWVDSGLSFANTWIDHNVIVDRAKNWTGQVVSVGRVIYEDDERVVLGLSYDKEADNWASAFLIYKPAILSRTILLADHS